MDAAWNTLNPAFPMDSEPVRSRCVALAAALQVTVPLPLPEVEPVSASQSELLLDAVQEHAFELAVTAMLPVDATAAAVAEAGFRVKEHGADCVTVKVCEPIVMVPVRAAGVLFGTAV